MRVRLPALLLAAGLALAACGEGTPAPERTTRASESVPRSSDGVASMEEFEVGHVHALALVGDEVFIGTHEGLFVSSGSATPKLLGEKFDVMGLTASDGVLYASGHPDESAKDYRDLGLRISRDAGRSWQQVSLLGKADFHRLAVSGSVVMGVNSHDGQTMRSDDGGKTWTKLGGLPFFDIAIDPTNDRIAVATTSKGLMVTGDAGKTWSAPATKPLLMLVAFTTAGLLGITPEGEVYLQAGDSWTRQGSISSVPEAMATNGRRIVVAANGEVLQSDDFGKTFSVRVTELPHDGH